MKKKETKKPWRTTSKIIITNGEWRMLMMMSVMMRSERINEKNSLIVFISFLHWQPTVKKTFCLAMPRI